MRPSSVSMAAMQERLARARQVLLRLPNVTGVGVGRKETCGRLTDVPAWRVYVTHKLLPKKLKADHRVPPRLEGMATDVVPAGFAQPALALTGVSGLPAPGDTISNFRGLARAGPVESHATGLGTLGFLALVNGTRQREVALVSNRHVLLAHGAGRGDPIYRPVFSHRGETAAVRADSLDPVAEVMHEGAEANHRFQYPDEEAAEYFVDCAAARMLRRPERLAAEHGASGGVLRGAARMHVLDVVGGRAPRVHKLGGATGVTYGWVIDAAAPVENAAGPRRLNNLAVKGDGGPFLAAGDSGAVLLNERDEAIGLLWGRNDRDPNLAYACHIHPVLDCLNVTMMAGGLA
jgi:hypothetical protein